MTLHPVPTYTDHNITDDVMTTAHRQGGPLAMLAAAALTHTCLTLTATEAELARCTEVVAAHLSTFRAVLAASPDGPAPTLIQRDD